MTAHEHTERLALTLATGALALAGCGSEESSSTRPADPEPRPGEYWFVDATVKSGLDFVHRSYEVERQWLPEAASGGVGFLDYDGDGWLDVYCVQSGSLESPGSGPAGNQLFRNDGAGKFVDVTESAGVGDKGYGNGLVVGDYDADGDVDLYVLNLGPNVLYRNEGDGTFTDVTEETGTGNGRWGTHGVFTDVDGDSDLDLFVSNYVNWTPVAEKQCASPQGVPTYCGPVAYDAPSKDTLFRNDGGRFTDVSAEAGIERALGNGYGVLAADFDGDGVTDIYVANDGNENFLWLGDGKGRFQEKALLWGCAVDAMGREEAGMGVHVIDRGMDGDWDLFVTHIYNETNTFYDNAGTNFRDKSESVGLGKSSLGFTGFGMGFHDFDHDGLLDLMIANGRVLYRQPVENPERPYDEPNHVYRGQPDGGFERMGSPTEHEHVGMSRALAFGDYDNDGDVDAVVADTGGRTRLLENVVGSRGSWLGLRLIDSLGRDALGAVVELPRDDGVHRRLCHTTYSFCAANDPRVHFGLGRQGSVEELTVTWPGGARQTFGPLEANRYHTLREGG